MFQAPQRICSQPSAHKAPGGQNLEGQECFQHHRYSDASVTELPGIQFRRILFCSELWCLELKPCGGGVSRHNSSSIPILHALPAF